MIAVPRYAGDDYRRHRRRELTDRGEHEEPAEAIERAEQREEVRRLQARRAEAEGQGRDHHREPAELKGEQELSDELAPVRIGGPDRRDDGLGGQDHHVPDLLKEGLGREERPVG